MERKEREGGRGGRKEGRREGGKEKYLSINYCSQGLGPGRILVVPTFIGQ